jgi:hypothetical protein
LLLCASSPRAALAAEAEAAATFSSAYNSRGMLVTDQPVFEPSVTVSAPCGVYFNVWGHMDLTDRCSPECDRGLTKIDLTVAYAHAFGALSAEIGYVEYLYPHSTTDHGSPVGLRATDGTREVYGKNSATLWACLTPELAVYYDFDEVSGFFSTFSLSAEHPLCEKLKLVASALVAWADNRLQPLQFRRRPVRAQRRHAHARPRLSAPRISHSRRRPPVHAPARSDIRRAAEENYFNSPDGDFIFTLSAVCTF